MGDPDEVDVVDPAVVNVVLGQLGVVEGQELTEGLVVRSTDGGKLAQPFERFGHVGMGLHGEPPAPTTLSERCPLLATSDSTCWGRRPAPVRSASACSAYVDRLGGDHAGLVHCGP